MTIKQIVTVIMCVMLLLTIVLTAVVIGKVSPILNAFFGMTDVTPPDDSSAGNELNNNQNQNQNQGNSSDDSSDDSQDHHEHAFTTLKQQVSATCEKTGHKIYSCECGEEKVETIAVTEHKYGIGKLIAPSCKEEGRTEFTCETCGYVDKRDVKNKLADHVWEKGATYPATCAEDEYTEYACSCLGCDETKKEYGTKALGHNPGEWELTREPVSGVRGEEVKKCGRCESVLETRSQGLEISSIQKNGVEYKVQLTAKNKAEENVVVFEYTVTDEGDVLSEESFIYFEGDGFFLEYLDINGVLKAHSIDLGNYQITIDENREPVVSSLE